jgi:hypothetical protein
MGQHGAVGEEQGIEDVRAIDDHRRVINHDVLPVVHCVAFADRN